MNDLIRSSIYTGMGAAVLAKKKFEEFVEELIQNNELTQDEGQRLVQAFIHQAEDKRNEWEARLTGAIDELLLLLKMPGRNELEVRLSDLIEKLRTNPFSIPGSAEKKNKPFIS
ncbi:MAG: hypothetical protein GY751_15850 [Bacteroidetes bacterium]|nr:hypothetical protein [Bacteroidota bacterium]